MHTPHVEAHAHNYIIYVFSGYPAENFVRGRSSVLTTKGGLDSIPPVDETLCSSAQPSYVSVVLMFTICTVQLLHLSNVSEALMSVVFSYRLSKVPSRIVYLCVSVRGS